MRDRRNEGKVRERGYGRSARTATGGSFIVDRRGTILGFDGDMEDMTGWPAYKIVGHGRDVTVSETNLPLFDQKIPEIEGGFQIDVFFFQPTAHRPGVFAAVAWIQHNVAVFGPGHRKNASAGQNCQNRQRPNYKI